MTTSHQYNYQDFVPTDALACPICGVTCLSLQDLNTHLDREHSEEDSKGALLSWLRNAQKKVSTSLITTSGPKQWVDLSNNPTFFVSDNHTAQQSEYVTRDHWQRETGNDKCAIQGCVRTVGRSGAGKQHCRMCGRLCCGVHTQYEIKLSRQAKHDAENGIWSKVCMECYVGREGYMNHQGVTRSKTDILLNKRAKIIDKVHLESNRLEKRLEKLARIHLSADNSNERFIHNNSNNVLLSPSSSIQSVSLDRADSVSSMDSSLGSVLSPKSSFVSNNNSILSMKLKYRDGEQSVTKWEDDKLVKKCPYCESTFTLINRKHHCRLCGKIVCGNTRCSKMIPLFIDMSSDTFDAEPVGDTRACCHCIRYAFKRKLSNEQTQNVPVIFRLYHQLSITRRAIENQLPKFHQFILALEKQKTISKTSESFIKATQIRKSLLDNFALYDTLVKSIKALPARSPCMKRLQTNICTASNIYLQQNMLPLQMLPRILKDKPERKQLLTQLDTFIEQSNLIEGFICDAASEGRTDDVKTLKLSLQELQHEIDQIRSKLD
ncbi:hypothetical protein G6F46_008966 [Rhizopus delemar]|uniref:FYVE-type domain-containing protein n=2 Tax=Rhizopus TaxID=4842 RepID=A0A9P6YVI7_9FUNG|nr:hypothetical protein G6F55_012125 [Rhizopus delemar]KAG1536070.1 hypothetical protein G6F51_011173 [Rhizopus arrhizus]KAG1490417.1 hypothetical protein G6F54_010738 [Rhizopus delemar]KAG1502268.1 hypothetical protein G6F53_010895 [Rhizopus delemar]KAG1508577.1 hypothetical protein G6F52_011352 [Rhizopus delemar]